MGSAVLFKLKNLRVDIRGEKESVLIEWFEMLHSLMYVSMIFSCFIGVLGLRE